MKMNLIYGIFLLFGIFLASYVLWNPVLAQLPSATGIGVIINTPADSANLPTGDLTIYGTSSDSNTTNCQVFADWNDLKPMQSVTANGPKETSDYSKWSFTYTGSYHGIVEGPNELTSKITCFEQGQNASSKSYSINVTGSGATSKITNNTALKSTEVVDTEDTANEAANILPANSNTSNTDSIINTSQSAENVASENVASEDLASEDLASEDVASEDVASEDLASEDLASEDLASEDLASEDLASEDLASEDLASEDVASEDLASEDLASEDTNILPANSNTSNTDSIINTDQSTEDVDVEDVANEEITNEDTNALPVNDNKNNGTYKILPLYSESDEESTTSTLSEDADHTEIRNMKTAGSQDGFTSGETIDTDSGTYTTFNSEQQGAIGETNNLDMTATEASDEGLTSQSESSTFFTYEPDLVEDTSNHNQVNTFGTSPDSESSFSNHQIDDNSIFGLKFSGLDDATQNKIEKKIEKLEDRITDRMGLFDLIG
jgi:hypothetical protein